MATVRSPVHGRAPPRRARPGSARGPIRPDAARRVAGRAKRCPGDWDARQRQMWQWYDSILRETEDPRALIARDYLPFQELLHAFDGRILDVGGGCGFSRRFIRAGSEYVSIDPVRDWLRPEWLAVAGEGLDAPDRARPAFVVGVAELLPFPDDSFDGALAMWSLNHVCDPDRVFAEVCRVLKPGTRWLAVLEDMEPTWRDIARAAMPRVLRRGAPPVQLAASPKATARRKLANLLRRRDWPLQPDHLRIRERDIVRWCVGRFRCAGRRWIGGFLTHVLVKLPSRASGHG